MPTNVDKYFTYAYLPETLQSISKPIAELAHLMDQSLPDGSEKSAGMCCAIVRKKTNQLSALIERSEHEKAIGG